MTASSFKLIVCLSGCDFISIWVIVFVCGFTTPAHKMGLPLICEPSVYTKLLEFHCWGGGIMCNIMLAVVC